MKLITAQNVEKIVASGAYSGKFESVFDVVVEASGDPSKCMFNVTGAPGGVLAVYGARVARYLADFAMGMRLGLGTKWVETHTVRCCINRGPHTGSFVW